MKVILFKSKFQNRRFSVEKQHCFRAWLFVSAFVGLLAGLLMFSCTKDNPTKPQITGNNNITKTTYSFTGYVIDGFTGSPLSGALVTDGSTASYTTGSNGGFTIEEIPYGNHCFYFSFPGDSAHRYTTSVVTIEGKTWENFAYIGVGAGVSGPDTVIGGIKNVAGPVKLYPLSGQVSGSVKTQLHGRAPLTSLPNVAVKITFDPAANQDNQGNNDAPVASNVEVGPSAFTVLTDASGNFSITGIPVSGDPDEKAMLKILNVNANGINWQMTGATDGMAVELVAGQNVAIGYVIMNPIVSITLTDLDNNFRTLVVNPEHIFEITYNDTLDMVSYAVLSYADAEGVKHNITVTVNVTGTKISIDPALSLLDGRTYTLNTYVYGAKGQNVTRSYTVSVAGGGLADVLLSNILTSSKGPIYNFPIQTPITFKFKDAIIGNPSVQVTNNDILYSTLDSTLTITPRNIWKTGTVNVAVVLAGNQPVRFSVALNIENPLAFVASNVYDFNQNQVKNGLALNASIYFIANKPLSSANVIFADPSGTSIPVTTTISSDTVRIVPVNTLKAASYYDVIITVENAQGESKSATVNNFLTTAAQFYAISDNVRLGNDMNLPRLDFPPNADIVIVMNHRVAKASATLSGVNVKVTTRGDTITIDPEVVLTQGGSYNLTLYAQDTANQAIDGPFVYGLTPRALVFIIATNVRTIDDQPVINAAKNISPWFKLSSAPVVSKMKVIISNPSIDANVTVNGDTLFIDPVSDFQYNASPTINVTGESVDGNYITFSRSFTVLRKPQMTVVASNVLNDNFEGLVNIPENLEVWYKMSRTPDSATVTATIDGVTANVRVKADTIFVKNIANFSGGSSPVVRIQGMDTEGISFALNGDGTTWPDWPAFNVRQALYPLASNTWGLTTGTYKTEFPVYGTMWVKWSRPLSTDSTKISWTNSLASLTLCGDASLTGTPNANVRVSGDTLFVTPIKTRIALNYNDIVGFMVQVTGDLGSKSNWSNFQVTNEQSSLYVSATNTKNSIGVMVDTFGVTQPVWLISSLAIDAVTGINDLNGWMPANNELVARTIRLSGDTIFFTPFEKLTRGGTYQLSFNVKLKNGLSSTGNELSMSWKVKAGTDLYVKTTNTMFNGSLVDTFDLLQPVWIVSSAPVQTVDAITYYNAGGNNDPNTNGSGANLQLARTRLSSAGDTIFWTPVDTLELNTRYGLEFEVTLMTGEKFTSNELTASWKTKALKTVSVKSTNTRGPDGSVLDTFTMQGEIWIVSSVPFVSVDEVNAYTGPLGGYNAVPADMQVLSTVRVSGDTIFFRPSYNLGVGTKYAVSFDVTLPSGQTAITNELYAIWEVKAGVKVVSANDMNSYMNQYRVFKNRGDSLVVTFSQAIDTSKVFSVSGFGTAGKLTYTWSTNMMTVTIKDTSTLANVKSYTIYPDYSPNGTGQYTGLTFNLTTMRGEVKAALVPNSDFAGKRPDLEIHTEIELVALDANYLVSHDAAAVVAGDLVIDTFLPTSNITITFNKAIDTAKVRAATRDTYFSLFNASNWGIPLDYTISFSSDGKTLTMDPVTDLVRGASYNVKLVAIPDMTADDVYSGPNGNYLTNANFMVQTLPFVTSIANLTASIVLDTNTTAGVAGQRIGASPVASAAGVYRNALLNLENALYFRLNEAAWNIKHADSVDAYQWRIRKVSHAGVAGNWYEVGSAGNIASTTYDLTSWNASIINGLNAAKSVTVNVTAAVTQLGSGILTSLRTSDLDGASGGYTNDAHLFNDSSRIEVQVRPVKDLSIPADGDYVDAGEFGQWSSSVIFADNIAPCDSDFVLLANVGNIAQGGVTITSNIEWDNNDIGDVANDSLSWVTLTFPEDMDTGTAPTLSFERGTALAAAYPTFGAIPITPRVALGDGTNRTGWTSARSYTTYILIPAAEDYRAGDGNGAQPWTGYAVNVSVAGMRDASRVTIAPWGSTGTTTGVNLDNGASGQLNGSTSVSGWIR